MSSDGSDSSLFSSTSLKVLRPSTLQLLGARLDQRKLLTTTDGKLRDYRGLAEVAGIDAMRVEAAAPEHTRQLISLWCHKQVLLQLEQCADSNRVINKLQINKVESLIAN